MSWTSNASPFAIQNLINIWISKMTALRDTLVNDSENWSTYYFCFVLFIGVFYICVWSKFSRTSVLWIKVHSFTPSRRLTSGYMQRPRRIDAKCYNFWPSDFSGLLSEPMQEKRPCFKDIFKEVATTSLYVCNKTFNRKAPLRYSKVQQTLTITSWKASFLRLSCRNTSLTG